MQHFTLHVQLYKKGPNFGENTYGTDLKGKAAFWNFTQTISPTYFSTESELKTNLEEVTQPTFSNWNNRAMFQTCSK